MYIEYITPQRVADKNFTKYHSNGGDFRPTWLIRTSDWETVPGHEAINGYHTLSYCWEQSGEMFQKDNGEYGLLDNGHHRVTTKHLEKRKTRRSTRYRRVTRTKHVTYNELMQQICKDFDIKFLWYDKMCIDQTNKEEKQREIRQMHRIYSNACYTVALVPEVYIDDPKKFDARDPMFNLTEAKSKAITAVNNSLWFQRSWTLEEVMMSTQILVIGRNAHFWSLSKVKQGKTIKEDDPLSDYMLGFKERKLKSASQVLASAHFRTSTKEHDKIFALANIFNDIISIDIDYDVDISTVMSTFYRQLVQCDLSIMCFGANLYPWDGETMYATTMSSYNLASWTGVAGLHSQRPIIDIALGNKGSYSTDNNMNLHIRCRSYTVRPIQYDNQEEWWNDEKQRRAHYNSERAIISMDDFEGDETAALDWSQWCMLHISFVPTHYSMRNIACCSPILSLSLTESCEECVVPGILFASTASDSHKGVMVGYNYHYMSPVLKKAINSSTYKVVGVIVLKHFNYFEPRKDPEEFMNEIFDELGCSDEYQDFCII